jgi:hypothetical protein
MTNTEPCCCFIRYLPVTLNRDDLVRGERRHLVEVGLELVERFTADAARTAVLEEQHRPVPRFFYGSVERIDIVQMSKHLVVGPFN